MYRAKMETNSPARRKSSAVFYIAQNDIADIKVRKQSANLMAQQLQQQLILQQQQLQSVRRDQVYCLNKFSEVEIIVVTSLLYQITNYNLSVKYAFMCHIKS